MPDTTELIGRPRQAQPDLLVRLPINVRQDSGFTGAMLTRHKHAHAAPESPQLQRSDRKSRDVDPKTQSLEPMANLFSKLAAQEANFKDIEFLSPVLRGQKVQVRIAGIVMSLSVARPQNFQGWGIFKPVSFHQAELVREPTLAQKSAYLKLFPVVRLVVSHRVGKTWFGVPALDSDRRFGFSKPVPINLAEGCERFETVLTRFDGARCWFEKPDPRRSRRIAKELRAAFNAPTDPEALAVSDCTAAEREVYENAWLHMVARDDAWKLFVGDPDEQRIKSALRRGGAGYQSHRETKDGFVVQYEVNGQVHHSFVDRNSLSVQSAGICLDGMDANFDLQSLVGVIAEGQRTDQIFMG